MKQDLQQPADSPLKTEPAIAVSGGYVQANSVVHGDCLEVMKNIASQPIDMILCDLPYGTTKCSWDVVISFEKLWEQYARIIKENGAIVLTGQQPFTTDLINSYRKWFRYEVIWEKTVKLGFLDANRRPLRGHENICVFYNKQPTYNPQKIIVKEKHRIRQQSVNRYQGYSDSNAGEYVNDGSRFPHSVVQISNWNGALFGDNSNATKHPTQKPVPLFEWLIKTYTNEGDLVLDNCAGSGTTAEACINTKREYILIEKEEKFVEVIEKRISTVKQKMAERLF